MDLGYFLTIHTRSQGHFGGSNLSSCLNEQRLVGFIINLGLFVNLSLIIMNNDMDNQIMVHTFIAGGFTIGVFC